MSAATVTLTRGTIVRDDSGKHYVYGGPYATPEEVESGRHTLRAERRGNRVKIRVGSGGLAELYTHPLNVAPADDLPVELKDAHKLAVRESVAKSTNGRAWLAEHPDGRGPSEHKTKREAVTHAAWRVLIAAYWAEAGE